jgi:uncharacterized protein YukE
MSKDIDVGIRELEEFIHALRQFQNVTSDSLRSLEADWSKCDETWQGDAKDSFTNGFLQTKDAVQYSLDVGEEACEWLGRFHEIVVDFDSRRIN